MSAADARTSDKIWERIGISSYEIQRHPISPFYAANGRRASGKGDSGKGAARCAFVTGAPGSPAVRDEPAPGAAAAPCHGINGQCSFLMCISRARLSCAVFSEPEPRSRPHPNPALPAASLPGASRCLPSTGSAAGLSDKIGALAHQDPACERLAMVAAIGNGAVFAKGRDFGLNHKTVAK
jgi:hypothetical protein